MTLFTGLAVTPAPTRRLQRACACAAGKGDCEDCRKKKPQRRAADDARALPALDMAPFEGGGALLAPNWRQRLEPAFGTGFGSVRVHDDAASHAAARTLHAHAFTVGQHVHFAAGRFAPETRAGLHLLAHELTHTIQQRGATAAGPALMAELDAPDAPLERQADAQADAVLAGRTQRVSAGSAGSGAQARLQREAADTVELDRDNGDQTGTRIRRTIEDRPCTETPEKRTTPRDKIFKWDRDANAFKLDYSLCYGSVRLTADSSIDYTRVVDAGKNLLDTLRTNPAAGADLPGLASTAIDSATLSAQGEVTLTVDGILRASVGATSTVGTAEQQVRVTGTLKVTPKGVSFTITGFVDVQRTPTLSAEQYSLNLKVGTQWFAVDLGVKVDDQRPVGAAPSSTGKLVIGAEIPLPNIGPLKDLTLKPNLSFEPRPGEDPKLTPGISLGGKFGGPDKTDRVDCWRCECPPPLPRYSCTPYGDKKVVDRAADTKRLPLMYQFDSTAPADAAAFGARVESIGAMVGQGYEVRAVRGYASPEGKVPYNQALATRRAEHAHGEVAQKLPAGAPALPAAEGVGELFGESATRPGAEAANEELTAQLVPRLAALGPEERLDLLEVDPAARADPVQRQQALDDIQAFVDGRDAKGRRVSGRARWERVFPFMRRVDVELHLKELAHDERELGKGGAGACEAADRAAIDAAHPIPPDRRLPQKKCRT